MANQEKGKKKEMTAEWAKHLLDDDERVRLEDEGRKAEIDELLAKLHEERQQVENRLKKHNAPAYTVTSPQPGFELSERALTPKYKMPVGEGNEQSAASYTAGLSAKIRIEKFTGTGTEKEKVAAARSWCSWARDIIRTHPNPNDALVLLNNSLSQDAKEAVKHLWKDAGASKRPGLIVDTIRAVYVPAAEATKAAVDLIGAQLGTDENIQAFFLRLVEIRSRCEPADQAEAESMLKQAFIRGIAWKFGSVIGDPEVSSKTAVQVRDAVIAKETERREMQDNIQKSNEAKAVAAVDRG